MKEWLKPYHLSLVAMTLVVVLFMIQSLVAMICRIRTQQTPGMPIEGGHGVFLFRADRARSNMIEVLCPFVLVLALAMAQGASATLVNVAACIFVAGRYLHTFSYYANINIARVMGFAAGNMATVLGIIACIATWV